MWIVQVEQLSRVCVWGIIENLYEEIDIFWLQYGLQKGKIFYIWVDCVCFMKFSDDFWLVRFDKWERLGD